MNLGLILVMLLGVFPLGVFIYIIYPFLKKGASYEKSSNTSVENMLTLSKVKKGEKVVDLGSGNGKILIKFAENGAIAYGYEINPILVLYSKWKIKRKGLEKRAFVYWRNFWHEDLSKFNIISLFQYKFLMPKLERKLKKELKKGTRIVSNVWTFPNLKLKEKKGNVFLYKI